MVHELKKRTGYSRVRPRTTEKQKINVYKQTMTRQTLACIVIFVGVLFVKLYPEASLDFTRNSIQLMLNQQTDVEALIDKGKAFVDEYILKKENTEPNALEPVAKMIPPLDTEVTSAFGMRIHPIDNVEKFHYGVDLAGNVGDKIKCVAEGVAVEVGSDEYYGNYLLVKHSDKIYSFYGHCDKVLASKDDSIKQGQVIATAGNTGKATDSHLHFEIREEDNSLDPQAFIQFIKK